MLLRPGNAGLNTAADHVQLLREALAQLPAHRRGTRPGRRVLVRTDAAGCTHDVLSWLAGQRLSCSVGFPLPENTPELLRCIPQRVWARACDGEGEIREGAWVAELTGLLDLCGWPAGMRVIVGKERPHPGAQLLITDADGVRVTAFATNTKAGGPGTGLGDLELRHRRHARCEDRIRCALVALGRRAHRVDPAARPVRTLGPPLGTQTAAAVLHRRAPGPHQRRTVLHLPQEGRWAGLLVEAVTTLRALPAPG